MSFNFPKYHMEAGGWPCGMMEDFPRPPSPSPEPPHLRPSFLNCLQVVIDTILFYSNATPTRTPNLFAIYLVRNIQRPPLAEPSDLRPVLTQFFRLHNGVYTFCCLLGSLPLPSPGSSSPSTSRATFRFGGAFGGGLCAILATFSALQPSRQLLYSSWFPFLPPRIIWRQPARCKIQSQSRVDELAEVGGGWRRSGEDLRRQPPPKDFSRFTAVPLLGFCLKKILFHCFNVS
ncbi:hypothetical protein R3P38DRAFT_246754 [Favolaschia claudopus]|uniref:Uncharacterized protein n=1 Tax=Favolaschia claudopus TaxID=2862362 RepID=A0AAW0CWG1_9AGAR